jgi:hypothetical protein
VIQPVATVSPLNYDYAAAEVKITPSTTSGQVLETVGTEVKWMDVFPTGSTDTRVLTEVKGGQPTFRDAPVTKVEASAVPNGIVVTPTVGEVKVGLSTTSTVTVKSLEVNPTVVDPGGINIRTSTVQPFTGYHYNGSRQCYVGAAAAGSAVGGKLASENGPLYVSAPTSQGIFFQQGSANRMYVNPSDGQIVIPNNQLYIFGNTNGLTIESSTTAPFAQFYVSGQRQAIMGSRGNTTASGAWVGAERGPLWLTAWIDKDVIIGHEGALYRLVVEANTGKVSLGPTNTLKLPYTAGSGSRYLVVDANGDVKVGPAATFVGCSAACTQTVAGPPPAGPLLPVLVNWFEFLDPMNVFEATLGKFTCPRTGYYTFSIDGRCEDTWTAVGGRFDVTLEEVTFGLTPIGTSTDVYRASNPVGIVLSATRLIMCTQGRDYTFRVQNLTGKTVDITFFMSIRLEGI